MPTTAPTVKVGAVSSTRGTRVHGSIVAPVTTRWTVMTTAAATKASGAAHRGASRANTSHVRTTGATSHGFATSPPTGARHSGSSTPASIACAMEGGMRAIRRPRRGQTAVSRMSPATTRNAPTAAGQPPSTAPVAASRAAPGVDQATVIGIRYRHASTIAATPIVTQSARSPLADCAGVAPTARRPVSTTANELVTPTSEVTIPATTGRDRDGRAVSVMRILGRRCECRR